MSTILIIEGTMGGCAALAAFRYQRRMDREVAARTGHRALVAPFRRRHGRGRRGGDRRAAGGR